MIPIGSRSILTVYLIIDGVRKTSPKGSFRRAGRSTEELLPQRRLRGRLQLLQGEPIAAHPHDGNSHLLLGDGKEATEDGIVSQLAKENSQMQTQISYLLGYRCLYADDRSAWHGYGHDQGLRDTRIRWHRRSLGSLGGDWRGARRHGERSLHRYSSLRRLLLPAQSRGRFHAPSSGSHPQSLPQDALRGIPGIHIGESEIYAAVPNWEATPEQQHPGSWRTVFTPSLLFRSNLCSSTQFNPDDKWQAVVAGERRAGVSNCSDGRRIARDPHFLPDDPVRLSLARR